MHSWGQAFLELHILWGLTNWKPDILLSEYFLAIWFFFSMGSIQERVVWIVHQCFSMFVSCCTTSYGTLIWSTTRSKSWSHHCKFLLGWESRYGTTNTRNWLKVDRRIFIIMWKGMIWSSACQASYLCLLHHVTARWQVSRRPMSTTSSFTGGICITS